MVVQVEVKFAWYASEDRWLEGNLEEEISVLIEGTNETLLPYPAIFRSWKVTRAVA